MPFARDVEPSIYYEIRGSEQAPALVLLRGLGRSLRHWDDRFLTALEARFRLVLLDNRCIGRSQVVTRPYSTAAMADDVARVLDDARIERAHVFGLSLGGMIAQWLAVNHPYRVQRLALGATTPGGPQATRPPLRMFAGFIKARLRSRREAIEAEAAVQLSDGFRQRHPEVVDAWDELARREPVSRAAMLTQLWAGGRHRCAKLHKLRVPTLIISSDVDALMPPANSRLLARQIDGAELAWLPGAGHDFATDCADETARLLISFMLER